MSQAPAPALPPAGGRRLAPPTIRLGVPPPLDSVFERDRRDVANTHVQTGLHGHAQQVDDVAGNALMLVGMVRPRSRPLSAKRWLARPYNGRQARWRDDCPLPSVPGETFRSLLAPKGGDACASLAHRAACRHGSDGPTCSSRPSAAFLWCCSGLSAPCRAAHSCCMSIVGGGVAAPQPIWRNRVCEQCVLGTNVVADGS